MVTLIKFPTHNFKPKGVKVHKLHLKLPLMPPSIKILFTNSIKTRLTYNKKRAEKARQEKNAVKTEMQLMCVDKKPTGVMIVEKKDDEGVEKPM